MVYSSAFYHSFWIPLLYILCIKEYLYVIDLIYLDFTLD